MSFPLIVVGKADDKSSHMTKITATVILIIYFVLLIMAIYLAVRDMQFLPRTSTKMWVLALSIIFPDLYVLLHGVSSSSQGVPFFAGSPMPGGTTLPASPDSFGSTLGSSLE